jgi:hypothetical protein
VFHFNRVAEKARRPGASLPVASGLWLIGCPSLCFIKKLDHGLYVFEGLQNGVQVLNGVAPFFLLIGAEAKCDFRVTGE